MNSDDMERRKERWHVGKEVPLAVIAALLIQTFGIVWWAASIANKLDMLAIQMAEFKAERYTKEDARRDFELMRVRDADLERRIGQCETRRQP